LSANIHGKNNWKVGTIGEHIVAFELMRPSGEILQCSRDVEPELFHAAIGGFGMLGCFTSVTLQLKRVHSGLLEVEPLPIRNLDEMFDTVEARLATGVQYSQRMRDRAATILDGNQLMTFNQMQDAQRMPSIMRSASLTFPSPLMNETRASCSVTIVSLCSSFGNLRDSGMPKDFQSRFW
jgi:hypothetical protein